MSHAWALDQPLSFSFNTFFSERLPSRRRVEQHSGSPASTARKSNPLSVTSYPKKEKKTQSETYCHASVSFHFHECESPNQLVNTKPCRRPRFLWPDGRDCRTLQCKIYFTLYFSIVGRTSHNSRLFIYLDATATIHCPHTDPLPQVYICLQRHWDHTQTHPANGIIVDYRALWCMS